MIRRNIRRLAARFDASRPAAELNRRALILLAYGLAGRGEPDDEAYKRHEADLDGGQTPVELVHRLTGGALWTSEQARSAGHPLSVCVAPEDADSLIRLAFRSLLRRDADAETYAAYREGFERGTTFLDLVNDILQSEEFKIVDERIEHLLSASSQSSAPIQPCEHLIASDLGMALTLLETRLGEKGCRLQLGAVPTGAVDEASARARMQSLMVTLASLEML